MSHLFDEFSKVVSEQSIPRRESLRRLGLAVTAGILGPLGFESAQAGKPPQDPCKDFCQCRPGRQRDQCVKACKACNKDPSRLAGSCGSYVCCGAGLSPCGDTCIDVAWDPNNCGACSNVCSGPDPHCFSGVCSECGPYLAACGNSCVDLSWNAANCGACGNVCGDSTPNCVYGTCTECPYGLSKCGDSCVDIYSDTNNCGACGNVCASYCYYGICDYYGGGGGGGYGGYGGYWGWY